MSTTNIEFADGTVILQSDNDNPQIVDYYGAHLDCTLAELARMTGKTIPELKQILNRRAKMAKVANTKTTRNSEYLNG